jgi:phenylpropionate dioxygenase-like ring-hydroxylating dioxygenase large terminal subunit
MRCQRVVCLFFSSCCVLTAALSFPKRRKSLDSYIKHNPHRSSLRATSTSSCQARKQDQNDASLGAWIPIGSASSLEGLSPTKIEIMGENFAVWNNPVSKKWSLLLDICPHRLAPLSQGRINDETGCVECGYHGWQFQNDGTVSVIPQLEDGKNREKIPAATSFSVHETGDLLWAFLPSSFHGESFPKSVLPEDYYYPGLHMDMARNSTYYVQEAPSSFHMLVENGLDPAHFAFAHCGVIARREDAAPMPDMKVTTSNFTHLDVYTTYKRNGEPRQRIYSFQRPSLLYTQERALDEHTNPLSWAPGSLFFLVPIREGRTRLITSVAKLTKPYMPAWTTHVATRRLLEGDYILHQAEINQRHKDLKYVEPTNSDTGARAWNQWMKQYGFCNAPPHSFGLASKENLVAMTMDEIQNPWRIHTSTCSKCRAVLKRARKIQLWSLLVGIVGGSLFQQRKHPILAALAFSAGITIHLLSKKVATLMEGSSHRSDTLDRSYSMTA